MSNQINEDSLKSGDLRNLVHHIFEIDSYKSKMGSDEDIVTLCFTVDSRSPAHDLMSFIEKGYLSVLDADMSPGEMSDGKYRVFVELPRDRKVVEHILNLLYGVKKLTGLDQFKFRYYKSFQSQEATEENLNSAVPVSPEDYSLKLKEQTYENFQNFFNKSYLESVDMLDDHISFRKTYSGPLAFKVINSGEKASILESITDKISIGYPDVSEIIFLTKYFGNYNITKFGNRLMFENNNYAVVLEKV